MSIMNITTDRFPSDVLQSSNPVLVDFWAPWCGYCRRLSPVIDRLAGRENLSYAIGKINIDEEPKLAEQFDVQTIPTLLLFQNGKAGEPLVAPESQSEIDAWLQGQGIS